VRRAARIVADAYRDLRGQVREQNMRTAH
jgi:hypothetical protein